VKTQSDEQWPPAPTEDAAADQARQAEVAHRKRRRARDLHFAWHIATVLLSSMMAIDSYRAHKGIIALVFLLCALLSVMAMVSGVKEDQKGRG